MAKCAIISPQLLLHCLYSMGGIIQHIYISVLSENLKTSKPQNLKTSKPQNLKTSEPQNLKTSKPQNLKTSKPQNLALLDNYCIRQLR